MSRLRLAFLGTPDFALPSLRALADAGHEIAAAYSQPPRPAGRGQKPRPGPVQELATARGWPRRTPSSLGDPEVQGAFAALELDAAVVVAYGLLLPPPILTAPRLGCLNLHASLLPRWRGAAPIQRALLAGDEQTGVTVMRMDEGLDTGPILAQEAVPIGPTTSAGELHDTLAERGAKLLVRTLAALAEGRAQARPQPASGITYAAKLTRAEERIDWRRPAVELERQVRAFAPQPGALFRMNDHAVKVLAAEVVARSGAPGTVLDEALTVACGRDALRPTRVQRAGRAPMAAEAFLRGARLPAGTRLPLPGAEP